MRSSPTTTRPSARATLGGGTAGTTLTNLKARALSNTSTDAVNGWQLFRDQPERRRHSQRSSKRRLRSSAAARRSRRRQRSSARIHRERRHAKRRRFGDQRARQRPSGSREVRHFGARQGADRAITVAVGRRLHDVKAASLRLRRATDAVNGSQLDDTNQNVTKTNDDLTALSGPSP